MFSKYKMLNGVNYYIFIVAVVLGILTSLIYYFTSAYELIMDGKSFGYIKDAEMVESMMNEINTLAVDKTGNNGAYYEKNYDLKPVLTLESTMDPTECAATIVSHSPHINVDGAKIILDEKNEIYIESMDTAIKALLTFKSNFSDLAGVQYKKSWFDKEIDIVPCELKEESVLNLEEALAYFDSEQSMITTGIVDETIIGNVDKMAEKFAMTTEELEKINPDTNLVDLGVGSEIYIRENDTVLKVTLIARRIFTEDIPFENVEEEDGTLKIGEEKIVQEGVLGKKDVDITAVYVNGVEQKRSLHSEVLIQEPINGVKKIASAKSMGNHPPISGSGQFWEPCQGTIGEIFRDSPSSNHYGGCAADILNSSGTPIYASASGTVTEASYYGSYGLVVMIDHGNGYSTTYAHNSKLGVYVGQQVSQGECISEMGTTGSSTANHLHFEIRYNGVAQPVLDFFPHWQ